MSDWNTVHLLNSDKFYQDTFPKLRQGLIKQYYRSSFAQVCFLEPTDLKQNRLFSLMQCLDENFIITKDTGHIEDLQPTIEDFNIILPLILFSECAYFAPHFRLGYRLLSHYSKFWRTQSLVEEAFETIRSSRSTKDKVSILASFNSGILNWLSPEDVQICLLDFDNVILTEDSYNFFTSLRRFFEIAAERGLGLVSAVNLPEAVLREASLKISINVEDLDFVNYPLL